MDANTEEFIEENSKYIYIKRVTCPLYLEEIKRLDYLTRDENDAHIIWYDGIFRSEKYRAMNLDTSKYLNKIPGMNEICYKYNLYKSLLNATQKKKLNKYVPYTLLVPDQIELFNEIQKNLKSKNSITWIMKPGTGYGGKGIEIFQDHHKPFPAKAVIQQYISPFLIDGHKFDLRLHLLITNIYPLNAYIYHEGIARFCSEKYENPNPENIDNKFQHLTNSCLNCKNLNGFEFIRPASEVLKIISKENWSNLWNEIKKLCAFVIRAIYPEIVQKIKDNCKDEKDDKNKINKYHRFFHLLGIDVLIGRDKRPYILELNDNPAMKNFNEKDGTIKRDTINSEVKFITSLLLSQNTNNNSISYGFEKII